MTDSTGLLQHARFSVPNYHEGYSTDDNARALIAMTLLAELSLSTRERNTVGDTTAQSARYLAFLWHAYNPDLGRFRNMLGYDRRWLETAGSEDSHARTLWSLGIVLGRSSDEGLTGLASQLFVLALPTTMTFTSPRAWAFALLGITEYLKRFKGDRVAQQACDEFASRLMQAYAAHSTSDWPWFEDILTYDNATLPRALLLAGDTTGRNIYVKTALTALSWLQGLQRGDWGQFVPIGCQGFFPRGGQRARFDQQPIEAYATIAACLDAYRLTGQPEWRAGAQGAFAWFLGQNDGGLQMAAPETGACYDGLQPSGANRNCGAESTLAFLLSQLEVRASMTQTGHPHLEGDQGQRSSSAVVAASAPGTTRER